MYFKFNLSFSIDENTSYSVNIPLIDLAHAYSCIQEMMEINREKVAISTDLEIVSNIIETLKAIAEFWNDEYALEEDVANKLETFNLDYDEVTTQLEYLLSVKEERLSQILGLDSSINFLVNKLIEMGQ